MRHLIPKLLAFQVPGPVPARQPTRPARAALTGTVPHPTSPRLASPRLALSGPACLPPFSCLTSLPSQSSQRTASAYAASGSFAQDTAAIHPPGPNQRVPHTSPLSLLARAASRIPHPHRHRHRISIRIRHFRPSSSNAASAPTASALRLLIALVSRLPSAIRASPGLVRPVTPAPPAVAAHQNGRQRRELAHVEVHPVSLPLASPPRLSPL